MKTKIAEPTSRPTGRRKKVTRLTVSPFSPQFAADSAVNLGLSASLNGSSRISILVYFPIRPVDDRGEGQCSLRRADACPMRGESERERAARERLIAFTNDQSRSSYYAPIFSSIMIRFVNVLFRALFGLLLI